MDVTRREFLKITVVSAGVAVAAPALLASTAAPSPVIPDAADATWGDAPPPSLSTLSSIRIRDFSAFKEGDLIEIDYGFSKRLYHITQIRERSGQLMLQPV